MKLPISTLTIATSIENIELLKSVEADIKAITQSKELVFNSTDSDEIVLDIEMDKNALKRSEIVSVIKQTVNGLKKEQGLKAKSPVVNFYVKCSDDLLEIMQEEPSQIAAAARATNVEFNKEGLEYTATEYPNVEVAIKI
jgi:hypothetical protein